MQEVKTTASWKHPIQNMLPGNQSYWPQGKYQGHTQALEWKAKKSQFGPLPLLEDAYQAIPDSYHI